MPIEIDIGSHLRLQFPACRFKMWISPRTCHFLERPKPAEDIHVRHFGKLSKTSDLARLRLSLILHAIDSKHIYIHIYAMSLQAGKLYYERGRGRADSRVTAGKAGRGRGRL